MSYADRLPAEREIIGSLLKGDCMLFGKRVELSWPDGLPDGMTEDDLRATGEEWAPGRLPDWVRADGSHGMPPR